MEIILFWFLVSIAIGIWAGSKGRSGFGWFILSILISPILAGIFLAVSADLSRGRRQPADIERPTPDTHVQCPDCAEFVRNEARVCKHCGYTLTPITTAPVRQYSDDTKPGAAYAIGYYYIKLVEKLRGGR